MDYYSTLGVNKGANAEEIKKAYRSLAMKHHPDRGGDSAQFQKIQEAYATLGDPEKRAAYDNPSPFGQDPFGGWQQANTGGVPPGFEQFFHHFGPDLGAMFGRRPQRNKNINLETVISLEEAFAGKEIIASYRLGNHQERTFEVKIPAGINDGVVLRIAGAGDNSFAGMPPGDAMLSVRIRPHPRFQRNGNDLIEQINISAWDAMLGKDLEVLTVGGDKLTVQIKEGTQPDSFLRIQGYGMPVMNKPGIKGNHMILIKVSIPNNLTEYQKNTLRSIVS
jgi:DnaJ-class molecular chaperone